MTRNIEKRTSFLGGNFDGFKRPMLAKQCLRLKTNPDSLCAKVLKAKYFPNVSLL